jgi:putative holliday junction resolvase
MPEHTTAPTTDSWIAVAFDFGRRRIGIAAGDSVTRRARPVTTLHAGSAGIDWASIARIVTELKPGTLVVGVPLNVDGTPGELTQAARSFARELERRCALRVATVDERWSSMEATEHLREARQSGRRTRRVRKEDIDAAAACVILERWFNETAHPVPHGS